VTFLVDDGKAMEVVYLDFSKPLMLFPTVSSWKNKLPMEPGEVPTEMQNNFVLN